MYLFMRDTQRERQKHRQRERQAPCREPDVGLDPGTPGSLPERKADTQPLSHPGVLTVFFFFLFNSRALERVGEGAEGEKISSRTPH